MMSAATRTRRTSPKMRRKRRTLKRSRRQTDRCRTATRCSTTTTASWNDSKDVRAAWTRMPAALAAREMQISHLCTARHTHTHTHIWTKPNEHGRKHPGSVLLGHQRRPDADVGPHAFSLQTGKKLERREEGSDRVTPRHAPRSFPRSLRLCVPYSRITAPFKRKRKQTEHHF